MFYFSQCTIDKEFGQNSNGEESSNYSLEEYNTSHNIFEFSQSYNYNIQEDNNPNSNQIEGQRGDIENVSVDNPNSQNNIFNGQDIQSRDNQSQQLSNQQQTHLEQQQAHLEREEGQRNQQNQSNMLQANHVGFVYLIINRWLANVVDPLLLLLFFSTGFVNTSDVGKLQDILRWSNQLLCVCCVLSNLVNIVRFISRKKKRELIFVDLYNGIEEEIKRVNGEEKLQQTSNNLQFVFLVILFILSQMIQMQQSNNNSNNSNVKYQDNCYQRYLFLVFVEVRCVMFLINYFRNNANMIKKVQLFCFAAWPIYNKEFDEYMLYNFEFGNQIEVAFSKDAVQSYLRFVIYIYEFILVLQIIIFGYTQPYEVTVYQEYSYFFAAVYYITIFYNTVLKYYLAQHRIQLSHKLNLLNHSVYFILFTSSYSIFILLQLISTFLQNQNREYSLLQFEPIFAFYFVCIVIRITLKRIISKSLQNEIQKHLNLQREHNQESQQNNNRNQDEQNNNSNIYMSQSNQNQINQNNQIDQNTENNLNNINNVNNINRMEYDVNNREREGLPHFQDLKRRIKNNADLQIQKNMILIINQEGYTITVCLSLQLFVYIFSDKIEIYDQNKTICNLYYFLSIFSFMFYFLASKKLTFAFEKLKNNIEPLSIYWIIPFQSYLNKLGWTLSWILSFILIYLYSHTDFTNNQFAQAEYLFLIIFSLFTFSVFQVIHYYRKIFHPTNYLNKQ